MFNYTNFMKKLFFILTLGVFSATGLSAQTQKNEPLAQVEQVAEYPGGMKGLLAFVGTHLKYPKAARDKNIQGKVFIKLIVEEDGRISETEIVKSLGYGCDEEVTRVVKAMPRWTPGRNGNTAVRSSLVLPIMFALGEKTSK